MASEIQGKSIPPYYSPQDSIQAVPQDAQYQMPTNDIPYINPTKALPTRNKEDYKATPLLPPPFPEQQQQQQQLQLQQQQQPQPQVIYVAVPQRPQQNIDANIGYSSQVPIPQQAVQSDANTGYPWQVPIPQQAVQSDANTGYPWQVPIPQQAVQFGPSRYQFSTPLGLLGRYASPTDCPSCGQRALTRITYVSGNTSHAWSFGLFCLTGIFCWLPYVLDKFKDVEHRCGNCGLLLVTWHRSGVAEVHQFG